MEKYDAIVIGAGMSGLAAGIRLAMFDKKVCVLEKHTIAGGLNSYYQRPFKLDDGRRDKVPFDVGLHALTNFAKKGERRRPLTKLLKQLRIPYDALDLQEQGHSLIHFPDRQLKFSNDFALLESEVADKFPQEIDGFNKLVNYIREYDELDLKAQYISSREKLGEFIHSSLLAEMVLAPLLVYGSAWEEDMDFNQFVIMFKSIYFEGFSRPKGGVRTIIDLLIRKLEEVGGELRFRSPVEEIISKNQKAVGVRLKKGQELYAEQIFSSAGLPETMSLLSGPQERPSRPRVGKMTFMESIAVLDRRVDPNDFDSTIVFYNDSSRYHYEGSKKLWDNRSAVVCCPDNYEPGQREGPGCLRVTFMANYEKFKALERSAYLEKKEEAYAEAMSIAKSLFNSFNYNIILKDVFSPTTVERYTWHERGCVYGSPDKTRDGKTPIENLFIIGTDQGFLGIVGSILSGISIGNLYGLMNEV